MKKQYIISKLTYLSRQGSYVLKQSYHKTYTAEKLKFYLCWQHLMAQHSSLTLGFLIFLAEEMDSVSNEVAITISLIQKYQQFRSKVSIKPCSIASVRKAVQELKTSNILISKPEKAGYIVNPRYLFKESEAVRRLCFNQLLEKTKDSTWQTTNLLPALGLI